MRTTAASGGVPGGFTLDNTGKTVPVTYDEFVAIRNILYDATGIDLGDSKADLVQARLGKRLRKLGLFRFKDYLKYVRQDESGQELSYMVDALTTNLTYFFREPDHFPRLKSFVKETVSSGHTRFRAWSAGCSSGEEAYSIAMTTREAFKGISDCDALILATDISSRMIDIAKAGVYPKERLKGVSPALISEYFEPDGGAAGKYRVKPELMRMIRFRRHNLNGHWPMKGPFDVIFCRNVMIYFDKATQDDLVTRFLRFIRPGGILVLGHSEGLVGSRRGMEYLSPGMYRNAGFSGGES